MAAPSPTARQTPSGIMLRDGYRSLVTFSLNTTVSLWEKKVTQLGYDGREPIDQTTMWNDVYVTKAPRALIDTTDGSMTCAYDPLAYTEILLMINVEQTITYTVSDGSTIAAYGYLQKFEPQEMEEGTQPEAKVTIVHTNWDRQNRAEAGPAVASVSGT